VQFIRDIFSAKRAKGQPVLSVEFFTPKTEEGERNLLGKTVPALLQFKPDYGSVTYGAGGGTRHKTLTLVDQIQRRHGLTAMAHLTCVGATLVQIGEVVAEAKALGIRNLLALRGDPPAGTGEFHKLEGGFEYAFQLVNYIRQAGGFSIGVAGFPEGHIACTEGKQVDWERLKAKIDCGADFVLTQIFFDNQHYYEMRDFLTRRGVTVPLCPGIIPILSASQIQRFTALCGARLPGPLAAALEKLGDQDAAAVELGIDYATRQCADLLRQAAPGIHFYTLNKAHSTTRIVQNLGLAGQH
jgi:methylenetetrahydrofolate reductase (NADPH)